jgi:xanthine dehydrogenase accessory factor
MIHWKESADILIRLAAVEAAGGRAALATVVRIAGSAYRRPGAKLLIEQAGDTVGSVSGGCLEADVREIAGAVLETGNPWLRHYETGDEDVVWGLGLGCNGHVDIFVQPASEGPLAQLAGSLRQLLAGDAPFVLATALDGGDVLAGAAGDAGGAGGGRRDGGGMLLVVQGGAVAPAADAAGTGTPGDAAAFRRAVIDRARVRLATGASRVETVAGREVFFEVLAPPPHLVVCGAGDDARPLVAYAADAGFRVTLVDHRPAFLAAQAFPAAAQRILARPDEPQLSLPPAARSLAVVKTHSLAHDREWVRRLLAAGFLYVGVLGPRARTDAILRLIGAGDDGGRVFGPVGLDLGADGPQQVAISIVAELLAFSAGRLPRHLSERREAIHVG